LVLALGLSAFANAQERNVNASYRDADIRTVIQQLGQVTKSPVVIERGVEGKVTLLTNGPITADEFRSTVVSALAALGYEITERDGALVVGPIRL
jgi:general secretion pathway protein D